MSGHSSPLPSRYPNPRNATLDTITPLLRIVKDSVSGLPIPGLEAAVGGAVAILETTQTMQNNKEDLRKLREDLDDLKGNLENAGVDKSTNGQVRRLLQTIKDLRDIIATCDKIGEGRRLQRFFQAKRIATQIADVRQSVRDALRVFQVFSIVSIENIIGSIEGAVATIDNNVITIDHNIEESKRFIILNKLECAPARFDANNTPSGCMDGTCVELLEDLIGHIKGTNATSAPSRFTLLCGIPGSGKSTIAKTIAVRLERQGLLAASFFFSRNYATRREITLVFSTIAFQLAQYSNEYGDILSKILEKDTILAHAAPSDQLEKLILRPLSQLIPEPKEPWIILLDALDECGSDRGDTLLELLLSHITKFPNHVRFFLTGRPEYQILSAFKNPSIQPIAYVHTLRTALEAPISEDIRHYLRQSLSGEWRGSHGWKVNDDDLNALVTRAGGLFIFASTSVKYIRDRSARHDPQISMDSILGGVDESRPCLLDQLYLRIIDDAAPVDDTVFVAQCKRVLGAVVNLLEPLGSAAIADLLGMTFSDVSRVISLLNSVLLVSEETAQIAHLSFSEYITGSIRQNRADLLLSGPYHHDDLANSSLRHMNDKLHRNICGFDPLDTYKVNANLPDPPAPISPSLRYACMYWALHLPEADAMDLNGLKNGLEKWLDTNILFWLEVLSLYDGLSRAIRLTSVAQAWYQKSGTFTGPTHYLVLLSDAGRFVAAFYDMISRAAGHIYYSALPFTPPSSELSRTYNCPPSEFVRVIKGVDPVWPPLYWSISTWRAVRDMALSPNGEYIAVTNGFNVAIRSSDSGRSLLALIGHTGLTRAVVFSPDGTRIATGSNDGTVRIWCANTGQLLTTLESHGDRVNAVAFSSDGIRIASGSGDSTIRIWSWEDGQLLSTLEGHTGGVNTVVFSLDDTRIVSGSDDHTLRIWSSDTTGQHLSTLEGHVKGVCAIVLSPNGDYIVSGSEDSTIRIWSWENSQHLSTLEGHTERVNAVAIAPDGARIASGSDDNTIRIWSLNTGQLLSILKQCSSAVDLEPQWHSVTLSGRRNGVNAVAFSPNGAHIIFGSGDGTVQNWSSDNSQLPYTLEGHTGCVFAVTFSPDRTRIASGSDDRTVRIWSSDNGRLLSTLKGHTECVHVVVFSPDGTRIASGSKDHTVRIWCSFTGRSLHVLDRHTDSVKAIVFTPDRAHIISTSYDYTTRVWSSETGELIRTFDQRTHSVGNVVHLTGAGQRHDFPPSGPFAEAESSDLRSPWSAIRVDPMGGPTIVLPSGRIICIIPIVHFPTQTFAQSKSLFALGLSNGGLIILDFLHVSFD